MPHVSDFTQAGNKIVLDLINDDNNTALTTGTVSVDVDTEGTPVQRNTVAVITALPGSGYSGSHSLEYNRLNIQDFVDLVEPEGLLIVQGEAVTAADIIPEINDLLGINLVEDIDFFDQLFDEWEGVPNETQQVSLPITADSLVYTGTLSFTLKANFIPLSSVLTVTVLDGLNLPIPEDVSGFTRFELDGVATTTATYPTGRPINLPATIEWRIDRGTWNQGGAIVYPAGSQLLDVRNTISTPYFIISGGRRSGEGYNNFGITKILSFQQDNPPFVNFFKNKATFVEVPATRPASLTDLSFMFGFFQSPAGDPIFNQDITGWDTTGVTSLEGTFRNNTTFNQDISGWDVSSVTSMYRTFEAATAFNQSIGNWDVSSVTTTANMFYNAAAFNQDISGWDVSNVTDMTNMFNYALAFNQDIGNWNTGSVTVMGNMFTSATSFNQDISGWDVSNVTNMVNMFSGAASFNQDLSGWDVDQVTSFADFDLNATSWVLPKPAFVTP